MTVVRGIPESLPRHAVLAWVESLGIDVGDCQALTLRRDAIEATVVARNADGARFVTTDDEGETVLATHSICIPLTDD